MGQAATVQLGGWFQCMIMHELVAPLAVRSCGEMLSSGQAKRRNQAIHIRGTHVWRS